MIGRRRRRGKSTEVSQAHVIVNKKRRQSIEIKSERKKREIKFCSTVFLTEATAGLITTKIIMFFGCIF